MSKSACGKANSDSTRDGKELLEDPDWVYQRYVVEGMSYSEIGEITGYSQSSVGRHVKKHGIEPRSFGEHQTQEKLQDKAWLREKYLKEDLSAREIADMVDRTTDSIHYWRNKHDIRAKSPQGEVDPRLEDPEWLREKYVDKGMTTHEIAELIGENQTNVHRRLTKFDIETRPAGFQPGEEHIYWQGGHDQYYGPNWNEQRKKALLRDQSRCQRCGKTPTSGDYIHVHHRKPRREFRQEYDDPEWWKRANRLENLITLCHNCHAKWEHIPLKFDLR